MRDRAGDERGARRRHRRGRAGGLSALLHAAERQLTAVLPGGEGTEFVRRLATELGGSTRRLIRVGLSGAHPLDNLVDAVDNARLAASAAERGGLPLDFGACRAGPALRPREPQGSRCGRRHDAHPDRRLRPSAQHRLADLVAGVPGGQRALGDRRGGYWRAPAYRANGSPPRRSCSAAISTSRECGPNCCWPSSRASGDATGHGNESSAGIIVCPVAGRRFGHRPRRLEQQPHRGRGGQQAPSRRPRRWPDRW